MSELLDAILNWLTRWIHLLGATVWVGGYAMMVFAIVPAVARDPSDRMLTLAMTAARVLSFAGTVAIVGGAALIARTRGYGSLLHGEWGGIVVAVVVLSVAVMALGDSGLRPALRRLAGGDGRAERTAQRWALVGLLLALLALAAMTRAPYATS